MDWTKDWAKRELLKAMSLLNDASDCLIRSGANTPEVHGNLTNVIVHIKKRIEEINESR